MFKLFKKKTSLEALQYKYEKLLKEAYELSKSNRRLSDEKYMEAQEIADQIEKI